MAKVAIIPRALVAPIVIELVIIAGVRNFRLHFHSPRSIPVSNRCVLRLDKIDGVRYIRAVDVDSNSDKFDIAGFRVDHQGELGVRIRIRDVPGLCVDGDSVESRCEFLI